jgi:hypothetical protein
MMNNITELTMPEWIMQYLQTAYDKKLDSKTGSNTIQLFVVAKTYMLLSRAS